MPKSFVAIFVTQFLLHKPVVSDPLPLSAQTCLGRGNCATCTAFHIMALLVCISCPNKHRHSEPQVSPANSLPEHAINDRNGDMVCGYTTERIHPWVDSEPFLCNSHGIGQIAPCGGGGGDVDHRRCPVHLRKILH